MGLRGKISLSRSAAEHFPIEFRRGRGWLLLPTDNHGLRRRVRTASGSDRIRKSREIYLGPVRCNPFPRGFVFDSRKLPDPVATARGSDTPCLRLGEKQRVRIKPH